MNAIATIAAPAATALADRAAFAAAIEIAARATATRNTYPILANVRVRGDGDRLFLTTTDMDVMIDVCVAAPADPALDFTVPAALLKDLVKNAPKAADMIALSAPENAKLESVIDYGKPVLDAMGGHVKDADGNIKYKSVDVLKYGPDDKAVVEFGKVAYRVTPLPSKDFPVLKGPDAGAETFRAFTIGGAELRELFDSVDFAISREATRYYLCGIYLHVTRDQMLRAVATDGHRLARHEIDMPYTADGMPGIIIPESTVRLIQKLVAPSKAKKGEPAIWPKVKIELTETHIRFMFGAVTITSKLVEGTYPDYERVIPKGNAKLATFELADFTEGLAAVKVIASDNGGKAVKLTMAGGDCILTVTNPDHGEAATTIPVIRDGFEGYEFEIGFNLGYLATIAEYAAMNGGAFTMAFSDAGGPAVVTGGRKGWLGILMPMRV